MLAEAEVQPYFTAEPQATRRARVAALSRFRETSVQLRDAVRGSGAGCLRPRLGSSGFHRRETRACAIVLSGEFR